jgi:hypothetical protein
MMAAVNALAEIMEPVADNYGIDQAVHVAATALREFMIFGKL